MADLNPRLYIDGKWTDGTGTEQLTVINPATEEIVGTVPNGSMDDMLAAIGAARRAFDDGPWSRTTPAERSAVLTRMGELIQSRFDELVEINIAEAGTVRVLANFLQVGIPAQSWMDTATRVLTRFAFDEPAAPNVVPGLGIGQGIITREPFGVAALITPFNFPFFLNVFKVAPALAAGCTAVLKPSPYTPFEALFLAEVAEEAGLPPGVLNVVTADQAATEELTRNPMVDLVSFTGSDAVGRQVYRQAAASLKKVILELGGKSANIICADADIEGAAVDVVRNFTVHSGQGCSLATRTLVHETVHDELVGAVTRVLSELTIGDPAAERTTIGPVISEQQRNRIEGFIRTALDEGAQLAHGGRRPPGLDRGFYVEPTLFTGVHNGMRIAREEVFGPVGVVIPFSSHDDAIRIANDSEYGLGGGVWSADTVNALALARRMRTGGVAINGGGVGISPHTPFGGYKQSGLGREWGAWGLEEFLQHKTIHWSVR